MYTGINTNIQLQSKENAKNNNKPDTPTGNKTSQVVE